MRGAGFSVNATFDWWGWAWGWFGDLAPLGMGALAFGPVQLHITWPI